MSSSTLEVPSVANAAGMPARRVLRAYLTEAKYDSIRMLRAPAFGIPMLALPVLLYLLFGFVFVGATVTPTIQTYLYIGFATFGVIGPPMFGFGVVVAMERDSASGLLALKRAMPMPPAAYVLAKAAMSVLFAVIVQLSLMAVALLGGRVPLTLGQLLATAGVETLGTLPFCAIGLFVGSRVSGAAAPGIVNLLYLPMLYLSGLFIPLPPILQVLAPVWPAYHLNQLVLAASGVAHLGSSALHVAVLAAFTLLFGLLGTSRIGRVG